MNADDRLSSAIFKATVVDVITHPASTSCPEALNAALKILKCTAVQCTTATDVGLLNELRSIQVTVAQPLVQILCQAGSLLHCQTLDVIRHVLPHAYSAHTVLLNENNALTCQHSPFDNTSVSSFAQLDESRYIP